MWAAAFVRGGEEAFFPPIRAVTHGPGFHWFGYYDVLEFDPTGRYLLAMEADFENRTPRPEDVIRVGMVDLADHDQWIPLGTTRAWCWQQGCRLQWRPGSKGTEVLWNDREGGRFVCRILNMRTGKLRTLPRAVYHVSPDGRFALGLDFARLQRLRPGYGYKGVEDPDAGDPAPKDSGIYRMDLETGESTLILSLAKIADIPYPDAKPGDVHYFNHIAWNPSGTRFLFLHRWRPGGTGGFRTRMFTADPDGKDLRLVTDKPGISHYAWRDDTHIMIHRHGFRLYTDDGSGREELLWDAPDGHESFLPGGEWLLADTYPQGRERIQTVYLVHLPTGLRKDLAHLPSPPAYRGEWRVDTHPRLSPDANFVAVDSAHGGEGRQVYLIDIRGVREAALARARAAGKPWGAMKKRALAWIEAEDARPGPGVDVDVRKRPYTSAGRALGVHADKVRGAEARWRFPLEHALAYPFLALRYASPEAAVFAVRLGERALGRVRLSPTPGWGYAREEWRWAAFPLPRRIDGGPHELSLEAAEGKPFNLDCLALVENPLPGCALFTLEPSKEKEAGPPLVLPEAAPPGEALAVPFVLGGAGGRFHAWGRAAPEHRFFFHENLPALFERSLVLDQGGGALDLDWIFTGPRGGVTLTLAGDHAGGRLRLCERYYDSPGFGLLQARPRRHPEWKAPAVTRRWTGVLSSVTVRLDAALHLAVLVNGAPCLRVPFLQDLTRHQLRLRSEEGAGGISGRCLSPVPVKVAVEVDPGKKHQRMLGFGGITAPPAYHALSEAGKSEWWRLLREYNLLIQREYPMGARLDEAMDNWDRLEDATPHYYGDNFPNGEVSDFEYLRKLRSLGGKVFFEFWALPEWMGGDVERYARAAVAYCRLSKERAGSPPDVVGVQNEVDRPAEVFQAMTRALRRALDGAGFEEVKIHMSDAASLRGGIARAAKFKAAADVWGQVDLAATHMYDYQSFFHDPDGYDPLLRQWREETRDKPFLSTELCVNDRRYQRSSFRLAFAMAQLYHKNLVLADACAICYCWTLLLVEQPSYGWTRSLFVPDPASGGMPVPASHQLRCFGAFSRRIREGMTRVEARASGPDLLVSAFEGAGGRFTLVALNRALRPAAVTVHWPGAVFDSMEVTGPYGPNVLERAPTPAGGNRWTFSVGPGRIVTLTNVPLLAVR